MLQPVLVVVNTLGARLYSLDGFTETLNHHKWIIQVNHKYFHIQNSNSNLDYPYHQDLVKRDTYQQLKGEVWRLQNQLTKTRCSHASKYHQNTDKDANAAATSTWGWGFTYSMHHFIPSLPSWNCTIENWHSNIVKIENTIPAQRSSHSTTLLLGYRAQFLKRMIWIG